MPQDARKPTAPHLPQRRAHAGGPNENEPSGTEPAKRKGANQRVGAGQPKRLACPAYLMRSRYQVPSGGPSGTRPKAGGSGNGATTPAGSVGWSGAVKVGPLSVPAS